MACIEGVSSHQEWPLRGSTVMLALYSCMGTDLFVCLLSCLFVPQGDYMSTQAQASKNVSFVHNVLLTDFHVLYSCAVLHGHLPVPVR